MKRGERGKEDSISAEKTKRNAGEGRGGEKNGRNAGKCAEEVCVSCELDSMLATKKKKK